MSSAAPVTVDSTEAETRLREARIAKLEKLKALGVNAYPYKFTASATAAQLHDKYKDLAPDAVTEDRVTVAGRIRAYRNDGMFIDLHDVSGKVQIFGHADYLAPGMKEILTCLDIGDMIGVSGLVRRTKRGELTVNVSEITVLAKTLLPLPDKFHGLSDTEGRYRQRYLDLIMNEESRNTFRARSGIIRAVRETLQGRGFIEVETPMMQVIPGGAAARPFITHHNALDIDLFMRIAPELYLKRLIVGGLSERVFEIGRNFRNEGISPKHNPEFTMMECYQAYTDMEGMMELSEAIFAAACTAANGQPEAQFGEHRLNFRGPFKRARMVDLVKEKTGIDFLAISDVAEARAAAKKAGAEITGKELWGQCVEKVFGDLIEPTIVQPTHVTHHPRDISPFAKIDPKDDRLTERFETFCVGREIGNAFSELTDPQDQMARFVDQMKQRESGDDEAQMIDHDYVTALEYGLPPTGGLGIGIDRLVMLLTGTETIRDVILFPTLKPR
jgi:lysyl-tRNA synthetase class 2